MKLQTKDIALIVVFASLQAVLSILPFTITIGISGKITLGLIGGPLTGVLLGPIIGGLAALIGSLIGMFLDPSGAIFGVFSAVPSLLGAITAGFVKIKKGYLAGALILLFLAIFYAHPFGRESYMYPWLHVFAAIVAFSPLASIRSSIFRSSKIAQFMSTSSIITSVFVGVLSDHIAGSSIAIWYFSPYLTPEIWNFTMYIYPIERAIATILTFIIVVPIYYGLKRAGIIESI
jgi:hypothetical protein